MAKEYHDSDFKHEDIFAEAQELLSQQALLAAQLNTPQVAEFPAENWEKFHATHSSAKFFKPRHYILLAFPELLQPSIHILEIGCGCGAAIVPTMKENLTSTATVCDVSPTAIANLHVVLEAEGIAPHRVQASVLDAASGAASLPLCPVPADICLLVFTLSAVPPNQMHVMLARAFKSLSPGGSLLIRDYGWLDMVSMRFPAEQRIADRLYYRSDSRTGSGTLAYFFSIEDLQQRCCEVGFTCSYVKYACVKIINRNSKKEMKRVFVQGSFCKPR